MEEELQLKLQHRRNKGEEVFEPAERDKSPQPGDSTYRSGWSSSLRVDDSKKMRWSGSKRVCRGDGSASAPVRASASFFDGPRNCPKGTQEVGKLGGAEQMTPPEMPLQLLGLHSQDQLAPSSRSPSPAGIERSHRQSPETSSLMFGEEQLSSTTVVRCADTGMQTDANLPPPELADAGAQQQAELQRECEQLRAHADAQRSEHADVIEVHAAWLLERDYFQAEGEKLQAHADTWKQEHSGLAEAYASQLRKQAELWSKCEALQCQEHEWLLERERLSDECNKHQAEVAVVKELLWAQQALVEDPNGQAVEHRLAEGLAEGLDHGAAFAVHELAMQMQGEQEQARSELRAQAEEIETLRKRLHHQQVRRRQTLGATAASPSSKAASRSSRRSSLPNFESPCSHTQSMYATPAGASSLLSPSLVSLSPAYGGDQAAPALASTKSTSSAMPSPGSPPDKQVGQAVEQRCSEDNGLGQRNLDGQVGRVENVTTSVSWWWWTTSLGQVPLEEAGTVVSTKSHPIESEYETDWLAGVESDSIDSESEVEGDGCAKSLEAIFHEADMVSKVSPPRDPELVPEEEPTTCDSSTRPPLRLRMVSADVYCSRSMEVEWCDGSGEHRTWSSWTDEMCGHYEAEIIVPPRSTNVIVRFLTHNLLGQTEVPPSIAVATEPNRIDVVFELAGPSWSCYLSRAWNTGFDGDSMARQSWEHWEPDDSRPRAMPLPAALLLADAVAISPRREYGPSGAECRFLAANTALRDVREDLLARLLALESRLSSQWVQANSARTLSAGLYIGAAVGTPHIAIALGMGAAIVGFFGTVGDAAADCEELQELRCIATMERWNALVVADLLEERWTSEAHLREQEGPEKLGILPPGCARLHARVGVDLGERVAVVAAAPLAVAGAAVFSGLAVYGWCSTKRLQTAVQNYIAALRSDLSEAHDATLTAV